MDLRFTWNPEKAAREPSDPWDLIRNGNKRSAAIGLTRGLILVLVVFVDRSRTGWEIIHIISARKADKYEQSAYRDQFR